MPYTNEQIRAIFAEGKREYLEKDYMLFKAGFRTHERSAYDTLPERDFLTIKEAILAISEKYGVPENKIIFRQDQGYSVPHFSILD